MTYKKSILLVLVNSLLLLPLSVFSHQPVDIEVRADFDKEKLHIRVKHPSVDPDDHYVRRVEIAVDENEPFVKKFFFQKGGYHTFTVNISGLETAQKLLIRAYSRPGGSFEKEFDIQQLQQPQAKTEGQDRTRRRPSRY